MVLAEFVSVHCGLSGLCSQNREKPPSSPLSICKMLLHLQTPLSAGFMPPHLWSSLRSSSSSFPPVIRKSSNAFCWPSPALQFPPTHSSSLPSVGSNPPFLQAPSLNFQTCSHGPHLPRRPPCLPRGQHHLLLPAPSPYRIPSLCWLSCVLV